MELNVRLIFVETVIIHIFLLLGARSMARSKINDEKGKLKEYRARRNFTVTDEPSGENVGKSGKESIFVVQRHKSRSEHYDFRLEIDGVLKSWAIPKGPSLDPSKKRLAVPTEDHPLEYAQFEGVIPEGEYGAGPVMVWDIGTYLNIKRDKKDKLQSIEKSYEDGRIEIYLEGEKLYGDFALIRTPRTEGEKNMWLFIKIKDEYASSTCDLVAKKTKSALTGKTMSQIQQEAKK